MASRRILFVFLAVLLLASLLPAQEYRGSILGRVTDPSGAAVPRAKVMAVNEATNVASSTERAHDGA